MEEAESVANTTQSMLTDNETNPDEQKEGRYMTHLRQALEKTFKKCLSSVRYSAFKENFRPLYEHNSQALKNIREQIVQQLESNIFEEISYMFEEENIVSLMNGLDELKEYQGRAWRPEGEPRVDVRSHVLPALEKHRDQLGGILKELESRNRMLQETVRSRQQKLYTTKENVDQELSVWQKAEDAVPEATIQALEDTVKCLSQS